MQARHVVLVGAGFVGAAAAATSAVSLYDLARNCGIPPYLAAALPIALDAGAAVGALAWISQKDAPRAWGRWVAVAGLLATIAGNAVEHALTIGLMQVTLWLVLFVGAAIPAMLWAVVHLAALMTTTPPAQKSRPPRDVRAPAAADPKPGLAKQEPLHEVGKPPSMRAQVRAWLIAELEAGRTPTGADADNQFGLSGGARCGANVLKKVTGERERRAV